MWVSDLMFKTSYSTDSSGFIKTINGCVNGSVYGFFNNSFFDTFPSSGSGYYKTCAINMTYTNSPPHWLIDTITANGEYSTMQNSPYIVFGRTDNGGDTYGMVSGYIITKEESDNGLGSSERSDHYHVNVGPGNWEAFSTVPWTETVYMYVR